MVIPDAVADREGQWWRPVGSTKLRVEPFRSMRDALTLKDRMDALNQNSRRPSPFLTYDYLTAAERYPEAGASAQQTLLLGAFEGTALKGYLALAKQPRGTLGDVITFLGASLNDRPHAVARPEDELACCRAVVEYLLEREPGWTELTLGGQDQESGLLQAAECAPPKRCCVRCTPDWPSCVIPISQRSLREYFLALGQNQRSNVRRNVRKLFQTGQVEIVSSSDPVAGPAMLDTYLDLERQSWKACTGVEVGRNAAREGLFRAIGAPGQPFSLSYHFVLLNGVPIAGLINGAYADSLYELELVFAETYRELGPGNLVQLLGIREAIERGCKSYSLLIGFPAYKSRWLAAVTETQFLRVVKVASPAYLKMRLGDLRRRMKAAAPKPAEQLSQEPARPDQAHTSVLTNLCSSETARPVNSSSLICCLRVVGAQFEYLSPGESAALVSSDAGIRLAPVSVP